MSLDSDTTTNDLQNRFRSLHIQTGLSGNWRLGVLLGILKFLVLWFLKNFLRHDFWKNSIGHDFRKISCSDSAAHWDSKQLALLHELTFMNLSSSTFWHPPGSGLPIPGKTGNHSSSWRPEDLDYNPTWVPGINFTWPFPPEGLFMVPPGRLCSGGFQRSWILINVIQDRSCNWCQDQSRPPMVLLMAWTSMDIFPAGGACDQLTDMLWLLTLSWELKFLTYSWDSLQF